MPSPNVGTGDNVLYSVSCASTTSCAAVGYSTTTTKITQTLIETWNGTSWTTVPSVNVGPKDNELGSVSCVSGTTFCAAVGVFFSVGGDARPLVEVRQATTWTRIVVPNVGVASGFNGVSCISATRCTAVGTAYNTAGIARTLIEVWNGASWTRVTSANASTNDNVLIGASCITATRCTAVGYAQNAAKVDRTLVEIFDGRTWARVGSPNVGTTENDLLAVSCISATRCSAVGAYVTAANLDRTLVEVWNGTGWVRVASPNVGTNHNVLFGVSCVSATECTAVGQYRNAANVHRTLIVVWNGATWTQVPSPDIGTGANQLSDISCVKGTTICKAVGVYANAANVLRTLAASSS